VSEEFVVMPLRSATIALSANQVGAHSCNGKHETCSVQDLLLNHVKGLASRKVWAVVSEILGLGERAAKARLSGDRAFTADELAHLLRQEQGRELLVAIMGDARPRWWVRFLDQAEILDARTETVRAKRKLERVLNAVDENIALIERAETALCVQDEDFGREQFAGHRSMARVQHRAMAAPKRR
jgi:hypothetical protein